MRAPSVVILAVMAMSVAVHSSRLKADVLFVDNVRGDNAFDGRSRNPVTLDSGPVRTISRALERAHFGDTIIVANTGVPYFESLRLVGGRHSGAPDLPFTIIGNGAIVDGATPIPAEGWHLVGPNLWKVTPWRKGHYQLVLDESLVPEHGCPRAAATLPEIPEGHWCAWRGAIYYQAAVGEEPADRPFRVAARSVGLTLYNVRHVRIQGLRFRYFQLDGINAHDLCYDVIIDDVASTGNARAGMTAAGSSEVVLSRSELSGNRETQLLITENAAVQVEESVISEPPVVRE
ncbi:MAG: right-handed parallel beta-helix repeat-containing protein [Planctomycetaceae bacterium]